MTTGDPLLIGITNEDIIKVGLTSGKVTKNSTNLIMEPLTIANNFPGPFTLNEGDMYQKLAVVKGTVYNQNFQENDFTLEDGSISIHLEFRNLMKIARLLLNLLRYKQAELQV
ncbi:hypothetical protein AAHB53_03620 [Niallia circulans]